MPDTLDRAHCCHFCLPDTPARILVPVSRLRAFARTFRRIVLTNDLARHSLKWYSSDDQRGRNGFDGNCSGSKACRDPPARNMVEQHNWQLTVGTRSL